MLRGCAMREKRLLIAYFGGEEGCGLTISE